MADAMADRRPVVDRLESLPVIVVERPQLEALPVLGQRPAVVELQRLGWPQDAVPL